MRVTCSIERARLQFSRRVTKYHFFFFPRCNRNESVKRTIIPPSIINNRYSFKIRLKNSFVNGSSIRRRNRFLPKSCFARLIRTRDASPLREVEAPRTRYRSVYAWPALRHASRAQYPRITDALIWLRQFLRRRAAGRHSVTCTTRLYQGRHPDANNFPCVFPFSSSSSSCFFSFDGTVRDNNINSRRLYPLDFHFLKVEEILREPWRNSLSCRETRREKERFARAMVPLCLRLKSGEGPRPGVCAWNNNSFRRGANVPPPVPFAK